MPGDAVVDPRFHLREDVLRGVRLTGPLTYQGVTYLPDLDHAGWLKDSDLRFFRSGRAAGGVVSGGEIGGFPVAAGSRVNWSAAGELIAFMPSAVVTLRGVPCRPGTTVLANGPTLIVTPDADVEYRGFPCKAGEKIDDYDPGLGFGCTSSRSFTFAGRPVPANVRVRITFDGGMRFDLVAEFALEGRTLAPGTHIWYEANGSIREIYERPG